MVKSGNEGLPSASRVKPPMPARFFGHTKPGSPDQADWEPLEDHLGNVAARARDFGSAFGAADWAYLGGLWHDLGKHRGMLASALFDTPRERYSRSNTRFSLPCIDRLQIGCGTLTEGPWLRQAHAFSGTALFRGAPSVPFSSAANSVIFRSMMTYPVQFLLLVLAGSTARSRMWSTTCERRTVYSEPGFEASGSGLL